MESSCRAGLAVTVVFYGATCIVQFFKMVELSDRD